MHHDAAGHVARRTPSTGHIPHPVLDADSFGARSRDGASVASLTVLQYALLHYLAYLPPGKVATWMELAAALGPHDKAPMTERTIQGHVARLRQRLSQGRWYEPPGGTPWPRGLIKTVHGRGLRLDWSIKTTEDGRYPEYRALSRKTEGRGGRADAK